jgi:hypothetical protein
MKQGKQLSVLKQTVEIISEIETKMTSESNNRNYSAILATLQITVYALGIYFSHVSYMKVW